MPKFSKEIEAVIADKVDAGLTRQQALEVLGLEEADNALETLIRAKMLAGLTRSQAIEVIKRQAEHDAALKPEQKPKKAAKPDNGKNAAKDKKPDPAPAATGGDGGTPPPSAE